MWFRRVAMVGVLVAGTNLALGATVQAVVKNGTCEGAENCMFDATTIFPSAGARVYDNGFGDDGDLSGNNFIVNGTGANSGVTVFNAPGAVWNRQATPIAYSDGYNFAGTTVCVPGSQSRVFTGSFGYFNNATSSHRERPIC